MYHGKIGENSKCAIHVVRTQTNVRPQPNSHAEMYGQKKIEIYKDLAFVLPP